MPMCLAVGSVANALLPRTKGEGMGLLPIALSVGLGIGLPIGIFFRTVSALLRLLADGVDTNVQMQPKQWGSASACPLASSSEP